MTKASLISQKSMSLGLRPACSRALRLDGTGPLPITVGSTPAHPIDMTLARGLRPNFLAFFLDISIMALAPALSGEELPGVMCPSGLKEGFNWARASSVVSPLMARSEPLIFL